MLSDTFFFSKIPKHPQLRRGLLLHQVHSPYFIPATYNNISSFSLFQAVLCFTFPFFFWISILDCKIIIFFYPYILDFDFVKMELKQSVMGSESNSGTSSSSISSPCGKRGRDPEDEVYVDNLHSHKRYLSEVRFVFFILWIYIFFSCSVCLTFN